MISSEAKWVVMAAMAALIGMAACGKKEQETSNAGGGSGADTSFPQKVEEEARQTSRDVSEGAGKAKEKTEEEARQTTRDMSEGVEKTKEATKGAVEGTKEGAKSAEAKSKEEAAKAGETGKQAMGMPGDQGKTKTDNQLISKIRGELRAQPDKEVASAAYDVKIKAMDGKVTLEGTVPSKEISRQIAATAEQSAGKGKVTNKMKVAERVGTGSAE